MLSAWTIEFALTDEYESKGTAIADTIAGAAVGELLDRDAATVQAVIDQYAEIQGVASIFVVDSEGEIISHTFVPGIPGEIKDLRDDKHHATIRRMEVNGRKVIDIASPVLSGELGFVHVEMDRSIVDSLVWSAITRQVGVMLAIFLTAIVVAYFVVRHISRPLQSLEAYARQLASSEGMTGLEAAALGIGPITTRSDEIGLLRRRCGTWSWKSVRGNRAADPHARRVGVRRQGGEPGGLVGPPGVGQTGLASGLLLKALENGYRCQFIRAQDLFDQMYASLADRSSRQLLNRLMRLDVLLIDELGYLTLKPEQSNIFFKLMEERYHRHSTIITTNLSYDEWANFLGNPTLVDALLSRVRHYCHTLRIDGPSLRDPQS